ncbi:hypothetical protein TEA_018015 [Camellia sinensis var. sinensis]|uniref:DDT domain-containing protein n=1 Tax=Camellia sinensis var. sinensis TaxID=542762 RepID=A0A4S4EB34_CAMSN|nr:hypothetical protein TEA_018015 [Camellia sinensis var. sinensis]
MAVPSSSRDDLSDQQNGKTSNSEKKEEKSRKQSEIGCSSPAKKSAKCASFEDQIYSSWNGKTCHQCRHRTMDFVAACKNLKKDKPCTIKFCHKCLWNRYGEKTEDVAFLGDWNCPKCRGICNCSFCRKKQGHQPTGILIHTARTTGFSSVSEMLHAKGPENFGIKKIVKGIDVGPTHTPPLPSNLDERKRKKMKQDGLKDIKEGNSIDGIMLKETSTKKSRISNGVSKKEDKTSQTVGVLEEEKKLETRVSKGVSYKLIKREKNKEQRHSRKQTNAMKLQNKDSNPDIPLPQGTELTTVAGIDLPLEAVGHALQFLEFCAAFDEASELYFFFSPVITPKVGKDSWLNSLQNCTSRSPCILKQLKLDRFGGEADDYDSLDSSEKLRLLNFLCDEFLCTAKIRSWIEDQNSKFAEKVKEAKERVVAAKHKEKQLKQKMQDKVAEAIIAKNGVPLSISEHEAIVSQIKTEAAQAHAEMVESKGMLPKEKQKSDVVRTEPILSDINGRTYWRLKGYSDESNVLLQDVGTWDAVGSGEKWISYNSEQEKEIEKYIYSVRKRRLSSQKITDGLSSRSIEADLIQ